MDLATIASIGIDLGKNTFHLVALDCHAKVIPRKKVLTPAITGSHCEHAVVSDRDGSLLRRTLCRIQTARPRS